MKKPVKLMSSPDNAEAWCVGRAVGKSFHVRRVFWGRMLARAEKRPDEQVRRVHIDVSNKASR